MPDPQDQIYGRRWYHDLVRFSDITLYSGAIESDYIHADGIEYNKLQHVHAISGMVAAPAAATTVIHICRSAGSVIAARATVAGVIPSGDKTVTVDFKVDAVSVVTPVTFNSSSVQNDVETFTLGSAATVSDSIITLVLTASGSTGTSLTNLAYTVYVLEEV